MTAIGLDVGTSGAKALLVDDAGRVLARASRGYAVTSPEPGAAELDPRMVLAAAEAVVAEVAAVAPGTAQAIGISCQGEAVVPVDADGTPLAAFSKIIATADKSEIFNGVCGAESGPVPVSAVAPALLVSEVEVQKKSQSQEMVPLLPAPERKKLN